MDLAYIKKIKGDHITYIREALFEWLKLDLIA